MKFNPDCIRDILLATAKNLIPDETGYVAPLSPAELASSELSQYQINEVMYWIRKLLEEKILLKGKKYVDSPLPLIKDISMQGYQFIESTKNSSTWNKIKPKLAGLAMSSITAFINAVINMSIV